MTDHTGVFDLLGIDPDDGAVQEVFEDTEAYERLIDTLTTHRAAIGLSQMAVAKRMGTTQSAVSDLERLGGDARYSTLQRYARAVHGHLATRFVPDVHWAAQIQVPMEPGSERDDNFAASDGSEWEDAIEMSLETATQ